MLRQSFFLPFQLCARLCHDEEERTEQVHAIFFCIYRHVGHIVDIIMAERDDHVRLEEKAGFPEIPEHGAYSKRNPVFKTDSLTYRILCPEYLVGEGPGDGDFVRIADAG